MHLHDDSSGGIRVCEEMGQKNPDEKQLTLLFLRGKQRY